jgi:hypothetical protein
MLLDPGATFVDFCNELLDNGSNFLFIFDLKGANFPKFANDRVLTSEVIMRQQRLGS